MVAKQFTVKDFITYNNPCFSCGNPINFKIGFLDLESKADVSYLRPVVLTNHTEVDLIIKYYSTEALKLQIFHKTNKILTNSIRGLTKYLSSHKLFLSSRCDKCHTQIESQFLNINLDKNYVAAASINTERLIIMASDRIFQIVSSFTEDKSIVYVDRIDRAKSIRPLTMELPLIPKFKFKNKNDLIDRLKMYITFS